MMFSDASCKAVAVAAVSSNFVCLVVWWNFRVLKRMNENDRRVFFGCASETLEIESN